MPSLVWQSVVDIGAVRALVRIGWPIAGTARAEPRCAAAGGAHGLCASQHGLVIRPSRTEPLSHTTTQKSIVIRLFGYCVRSARVPKCRIYFAPFLIPTAAIAAGVSQTGTLPGLS